MEKKLTKILSLFLAITMILSNIIVVNAAETTGSLLKEDRFTDIGQVLIGSGGYITGLVIHPDDPDIMYIRTDVGGAYRWEAETESWTQIMSSFTKDGQYAVDGIAIDPNNKDIVYVCVGNDQPWAFGWDAREDYPKNITSSIWKSTDRGNTWTDISPSYTLRFHGNSANRGDGECIAVDPNNSDVIWVGSRSLETYQIEPYKAGLHYTTDGGKTWNEKMLYGNGTQEEVRCVFFDPSSVEDGKSQTIYAVVNIIVKDENGNSVNEGGLYRSLDAGANWEKVPNEGYTQGETYSATWDVGEEFYKQLKADNGKTINNNYQAGPFTYTMNSWYDYTLGTPFANGSSYQTTITDLSNSKTGYIRSDGNKMIIDKPDTTLYTHAVVTFTAPVTGTYSFVPLAISGSNWVTAEGSFYVQDFHVILKKGEETLYEASTGRWSSNIGMTGFNTALTNVSLQTGEKISVYLGGDYESERVMSFDFKVELIESEPTVLPEATYYHEAHLDSEGGVLMTFGGKRETNTSEPSVRGLYRLNADGSWENFGVNLPSDGFTTYMSLEVDDTDPDRVAVGVGSGIVNGSGETAWRPPIYYTTDGGKTWTDVTPINSDKIASSWKGAGHSSGSVASLVFGEGDEMWMTDWTEVYYTPSVSGATDAARNWSTKIKNIEELVTFSMLSPVGGDNLFTAADTKSAFLIGDDEVDVYPSIQASSSDRGKFQQGDYSAGNPNFIVGAYSSQDSSEGGYVYISENGGETWSIASGVNGSTTIYPGDAAVSASDTNKLVIATLALGDGSKILYSTDKGTTWTEATGAPTGLFAGDMWHGSSPLESDKNKGNIFYALASDGFYRSEDYGATWECTSTVPKLQQNSDGAYVKKLLNVVTYENCPGDVWVSSAAGVWYSNDFGDNFVQIEGLTNGSISLGKGRTDGSYVLYFNGILEDNNKAIYYSEDKGESFVRITDYSKYSLAKEGKLGASRNTYGRVYMGTSGLGWKYLDAPLDDYKITKSWNLHDITATGLGNIVNTGESFVGTKISNLDYFGDFKYSVDWYGYVRNEITATQINATENAAGGSGGCGHGAITLMSDGIRMHTDYTNPWHITFTAPATGLYNLAPTRALTVQNPTAATKFYITAAGENLEIGPGGETEINTNNLLTAGTNATINLLDGCEVELKQGETIVISGVAGGNSWNTYFTLNFEIELLEVNHEHVYDNDCDKTCDVCGYERETEHSWDDGWTTDETNHWHSCSVCGAVNDTVAHTFDSISGTVCSSCGYIKNAIETWNMHDELKKGLSALVATGADYKGTAFSALDLGAFDFNAAYYSKVWEINANGFKGASIYGSSTNNEQHDMLALTGGAVKTHADYNNATYITFTAPKSGKYTIVPTADLTVSGTGTSFTVSANGTALAIGPNGETDLTATTAGLKPVEVTLAAGDTIVVSNKGDSWNTYFTFDFNVALTKDLTPIATYNMADEIRNVASALDFGEATYLRINKAMGEYAFGAFNLVSIKAATAVVSTTLQEIENKGGKYTIYPNQKNSGTAGWQTNWYNNPNVSVETEVSKFDGIAFNSKIWTENYAPAVSFTFTAPKAGIYTLTPATAYTGKDGSIYNATNRDATITVNVNGVDSSVAVATKTTGNLPELGEIHLNKGETITFTIAMAANTAAKEGAATSVYMNFDVNLMEETPVFAGASLNLKSDLTVSFTVKKTWFTESGYSNPVVRYEIGDRTIEVSDYTEVTSTSGEQRYSFALTGVGPQQMTDTIIATLIATNAEGKRFAYETREYSVKTYCDNQLNRYSSGEVATLCVDILNYGAAMQTYTGYNTENLANADLTDAQKALATPARTYSEEARKVLDNTDKIATWKSAGLYLDTSIAIDVFFVADDVTGYYVEFNDGTIVEEKDFMYNQDNGRYYARYTNLSPAEMQKVVTAVVKNADGEVISGTVSYNVEAYVARNYNSEKTALANACIALMAYGDSAYAYVN